MIRNLKACCLFVGLCFLCLASPTNGLNSTSSKFESQFERLRSIEADSQGIEETEASLKELRWAYLAADNAHNLREGFARLLNALADDVAKLDPEKCQLERLHNFANQISVALKSKLAEAPIIVRYIKHMANAQFGLCNGNFGQEFKKLVEATADESLDQKLDLLVDNLAETMRLKIGDQSSFSEETLQQLEDKANPAFPIGLMKFIRATKFGCIIPLDLRFNVYVNKEEFLDRFDDYFEELCSNVEFALGKFVDIYRVFLPQGMVAEDDELAREWVQKVAVCRVILENSYKLSLQTRSIWTKQSEQAQVRW